MSIILTFVQVFNRLRGTQIHFANKVSIVNGDVSRPNLGLAKCDYEALVNEVNCIFHCAASIYHEESLRNAAHTNVGGTKEMLALAKRMKSLRVNEHIRFKVSSSRIDGVL